MNVKDPSGRSHAINLILQQWFIKTLTKVIQKMKFYIIFHI